MEKLFAIFIVVTFMNLFVLAQDNLWLKKLEKIKPLESTEKDVENILGKPKDRYENIGEYLIKEGEVSVIYSEGRCIRNSASEFDVEKGTVVSFDFTPKIIIRLSFLKLNLNDYTKEEPSTVLDTLNYYNSESGINISVRKGIIKFVEFSGPKNSSVKPCQHAKLHIQYSRINFDPPICQFQASSLTRV